MPTMNIESECLKKAKRYVCRYANNNNGDDVVVVVVVVVVDDNDVVVDDDDIALCRLQVVCDVSMVDIGLTYTFSSPSYYYITASREKGQGNTCGA